LFNYKSDIFFINIENKNNYKITYNHTDSKIGLEDPRMIKYNDGYLICLTECDHKILGEKTIKPVIHTYDMNYNLLRKIHFKNDVTGNKNWCPFIHNEKIMIHTHTYPIWKVIKINEKVVVEQNVEKMFKIKNMFLRCSTSWKPFNDKYYICGLHTKTYGFYPTIRSMLVLINRISLLPEKYTEIFCMGDNHERIQFLSGLETDDFYVYLAYGVSDWKMVIKRIAKYRLSFK
jgi:hypothetical protein